MKIALALPVWLQFGAWITLVVCRSTDGSPIVHRGGRIDLSRRSAVEGKPTLERRSASTRSDSPLVKRMDPAKFFNDLLSQAFEYGWTPGDMARRWALYSPWACRELDYDWTHGQPTYTYRGTLRKFNYGQEHVVLPDPDGDVEVTLRAHGGVRIRGPKVPTIPNGYFRSDIFRLAGGELVFVPTSLGKWQVQNLRSGTLGFEPVMQYFQVSNGEVRPAPPPSNTK